MKVLISQRIVSSEKGGMRDALEHDYIRFFESFGLLLVPVPNVTTRISEYLASDIKGVILSGGNDICMESIDEHSECSCQRDATEGHLLSFATENRVPTLAICRGCQFLNLFFGGTLLRDLASTVEGNVGHVATTHDIDICDSRFESLLGCTEAKVNSFHNHGFTQGELSPDLRAFAKSKDGVIEGVYHPALPIIGMMWHPERMARDTEINRKITESFISWL